MRALLDINVIIALLEPDHAFHEKAHAWWARNDRYGWASCPLTENGVVRILSNPGYSRRIRFTPGELIGMLGQFAEQTNHEFWVDNISLRDATIFAVDHIHGSRQLTDLYLLALAVAHGGRLVTFDGKIPISAVYSAKHQHLVVV